MTKCEWEFAPYLASVHNHGGLLDDARAVDQLRSAPIIVLSIEGSSLPERVARHQNRLELYISFQFVSANQSVQDTSIRGSGN